jgi:hypothetical protein
MYSDLAELKFSVLLLGRVMGLLGSEAAEFRVNSRVRKFKISISNIRPCNLFLNKHYMKWHKINNHQSNTFCMKYKLKQWGKHGLRIYMGGIRCQGGISILCRQWAPFQTQKSVIKTCFSRTGKNNNAKSIQCAQSRLYRQKTCSLIQCSDQVNSVFSKFTTKKDLTFWYCPSDGHLLVS